MRDLMRWDPFQELEPVLAHAVFTPRFDVTETSGTYVFKADLPGVKESDLDISLTGNQLRISGERSEEERAEEGDRSHVVERSYGRFMRTFGLPEGCDPDHARAELKDGVLTLTLPKRPEMQPKKINVSSEGEKGSKGKA
jgi:HSP20 family protein